MEHSSGGIWRAIRLEDNVLREIVTLAALAALILLAIRNIFTPNTEFIFDTIYAALVIWLFGRYYKRLHQDSISYFFLVFAMILHNFNLYPLSPLGIRFDHYMHFTGGLAIALIADRFFIERMSMAKRFFLIVFFTMGVGALGELVEWLGYSYLGFGDGMFFHGIGDEIEWSNAMIDMIFNGLGAMAIGLSSIKKRPVKMPSF